MIEDDSDSSFYSDDAVLLSELIEEHKKLYPPKQSVVTPPNEDKFPVTLRRMCSSILLENSGTFNQDVEEDVNIVKSPDNGDSAFFSDDTVLLSELLEEYKKLYPPKTVVTPVKQQDSEPFPPNNAHQAFSKQAFRSIICEVTDPGRKLHEVPCNSNHDGVFIKVVNNHEKFNVDVNTTRLENELIDTRKLLNNAKQSLRMLKQVYWLRNSEGEGCESSRSFEEMKKEYGVLIHKSGSLTNSKRKIFNEVRTTRQSIGVMTEELCRILGVGRNVDFPWESGMPYSHRRV